MQRVLFPIVGVRAWRVAEATLRSTYYDEAWQPGQPLTAVCNATNPCGTPPQLDCTCGVYAWRDDFLTSHNFPIPRNIDLVNYIYGEVALWGRIIEHEFGLRAQYAQPLRLINFGNVTIATDVGLQERSATLTRVSSVYGITVCEIPFKVRKGCKCPLCKTTTRGFSELDLSSILPDENSPSKRKARKRNRRR